MKWITTDYKGNKKVWYSEDVIEKIKEIINEVCFSCGECETEFSKKDYCDWNELIDFLNEVDE